MGEQSAQTLAPHTRLPCTACGYDIGGVAAGSACPECGAPVFGFEAAEARALQQRGMTMVLWGLPGTLLTCLLGQVVYLIVGTGEGRSGPVSAQRGAIAMAIVPMMVTLVGLWMAVGPTSGTTLGRWLRRIAILMILTAAVLGAQRLVAHVSPNTFLGYRGTTVVRSYLSTPWLRSYGLACVLGVAPVLAGLWAAWLSQEQVRLGLAPARRRIALTAIAAAALSIVPMFATVVDEIAVRTLPTVANVRMTGRPTIPGQPVPGPSAYAEWVNPDSALFVAVIGYVLVMLLGVWLWVGMLRLRERMVRAERCDVAPKSRARSSDS